MAETFRRFPTAPSLSKKWADKIQAFFNLEEGLGKAIDEMRKKLDR